MLGGDASGWDVAQLFAGLDRFTSIALAVSGGADSLALMVLVERWQRAVAGTATIRVYSVDHGLRPEAAKEAAGVVEFARSMGFEARVLRWRGPRPKRGVQAAARTARYKLMGEAMAEDGAEVLLTGHHGGDQAETILMRAAHG
ncbi:MAG: tRNA lysidine(34) synthetase TilS, partial [Alphaproteobacteria bacterium]|nr:tRNA lysidine(34) synthetase TilS [Alphaproteobacteria bacterium]